MFLFPALNEGNICKGISVSLALLVNEIISVVQPLPILQTSQISAQPQIKLDSISKSQTNLHFLFSDIVTVVKQKTLAFQPQITPKFLAVPSHTSLQSERSNSLADEVVTVNFVPCPLKFQTSLQSASPWQSVKMSQQSI